MTSATRWFPQWEASDVNLSSGGQPPDAIPHTSLACLPCFGFVSVWELTGVPGDDRCAAADDARRRAA